MGEDWNIMSALVCNTILNYPNATGVMPLLFSIRDCVPLSFPAILLAIFLILWGGQQFLVTSKTTRTRTLIALLSASFMTTVLSMMLALAQLVGFSIVLFWAFLTIIWFALITILGNG